MNRDPRTSFHEFQSDLVMEYPPAFADCAYLLRLILDGESPMGLSPGSNIWLAPFALEKFALRGQLRRPPIAPADVLVTHFPGRTDYVPFLAPIVTELRSRGRSVAVALPPDSARIRAAYGEAPTFELHALSNPNSYSRARIAATALTGAASRFARRHELSGRQRAYLSIVLQAYFWQAELFRLALRRTGARLVFGLHFMLHPGLRAAVRKAGDGTGGIRTLFIQHGVFSGAWPTHDFHGADRVLLWSEEAAHELARFPQPLPVPRVTGSPKAEWLRSRSEEADGRTPNGSAARPRVLVLGTNGEEERDMAALRLAAAALGDMTTAQVAFRPHPAEPEERYHALFSEGLLRPEQLDRLPDVYASLAASTLVIGTQSTLLLEAAALGVPAVQLLPELFELNWADRGMPSASTRDELRTMTDRLVSDDQAVAVALTAARPIVESAFGMGDGAARRGADVIEEMLDLELKEAV